MEKELNEQFIRNEIEDFCYKCCPFGSIDVRHAIEFALSVGLNSDDLYELCEDFTEETNSKFKDLDVCYIIYEHVLQMARNEIGRLINFDFLNDGTEGEIYTAGNYCATSYDYPEEAKEELKDKILESDKENIAELLEDDFVNKFLDELGILTEIKNRIK